MLLVMLLDENIDKQRSQETFLISQFVKLLFSW
jgi:hypothetical protein